MSKERAQISQEKNGLKSSGNKDFHSPTYHITRMEKYS
jgi:hypothetical protein